MPHDPPVFDGHNDALTREDHAGLAEGRPGGAVDLPRMARGGVRGGIFAVYVPSPGDSWRVETEADGSVAVPLPPPVPHAEAAAYATTAAGRLLALERAGHVRIARGVEDLDRARAGEGPPVAVLHLEGAEAIDPDLEALELWHAAGLRSLGPAWSRPTAFASGVQFRFPSSPDTGPGLTDAGRALVRRCAELGILVDVSHLDAAGFRDVAALDAGPVVASHSGAHALCAASRNLTDAQLDVVGSTGGLVGVVFATKFLRPDFAEEPDTPLELVVQHVRHIADRIGVAHVALGSDWDGALPPAALADPTGVPRLLAALRDDGFTPDELEAVAWGNWRRVLAAWWGQGSDRNLRP